jgi:MFS family permease
MVITMLAFLRRSNTSVATLLQRDFGLVWLSSLVSLIGDWALIVGLPIVVYRLTGSALLTSVAFIAGFVPNVALGSFAGVLVDRWDRRRTLIVSNLLLGLGLLPLLWATSGSRIWIVYVVQFVEACLAQLVMPARGALLPALVKPEELSTANALDAVGSSVGRLTGPVLGGVIVAIAGLGAVVAVDSLSFLAAALLLLPVRSEKRPSGEQVPSGEQASSGPASAFGLRAFAGEWLGGMTAVLGSLTLRTLFLVLAMTRIGEGIMAVLLVVFVTRALHGSGVDLGFLLSAQAVGGLVGGIAVAAFARRWSPFRLAWVGAVVLGLIDLAIVDSPLLLRSVMLVATLFVAVGLPVAAFEAGGMTLFQLSTKPGLRGRVFGFIISAGSICMVAGMAIGGLLGDRLGPIPVLNMQGGSYVVAGLLLLLLLGSQGARSAIAGTAVASNAGP